MTSGWRRPALSFFRRKKTTEGHRYCTGTFYRLQISTTDLFTGTGTVQYRYHRYNVLSQYRTNTVPVKRHRGSYRETWSRRLRFI